LNEPPKRFTLSFDLALCIEPAQDQNGSGVVVQAIAFKSVRDRVVGVLKDTHVVTQGFNVF
jgi:hypothetical protein